MKMKVVGVEGRRNRGWSMCRGLFWWSLLNFFR